MSMLSVLIGASAAAAAKKAEFINKKRGKSKAQKEAIDFFSVQYGGAGCLQKAKAMSIQEYQKRVIERCNATNFKARAMQKIGLDPREISEIQPICASAYVYDEDSYFFVSGNEVVSSKYSISWIFFSATQIHTYTYTFDMISDNTSEITRDFFYQDITCFQTETELVETIIYRGCANVGCLKTALDRSYKQNYIRDTLVITVPNKKHVISIKNSEAFATALQGAKAMLRERKFTK